MACKSGKRRFRTENAAKVALVGARIQRELRGRQNRRERSVYRCPMCRGWHMTSQA